jgi:hypothetical protein
LINWLRVELLLEAGDRGQRAAGHEGLSQALRYVGHRWQISIHWIRHTTLTWVERNFGFAGVRPSDLLVSVMASTRADCSFGLGRAQFLEGDLN